MSEKASQSGMAAGRLAFIVNPVAGGGRALRGYRTLRNVLRADGPSDDYISGCPGQAADLAARAVGRGYDAVIAVGGDGTVHEGVNGLFRAGLRDNVYRGPPLGLLPLGRGNDFARTFGVGGTLSEVWGRQSENINRNPPRIDVGRATVANDTQYHFVNMCGMGLDADVAATANRVPRFLGGVFPYLAGIFLNFAAMRSHSLHVELSDVQKINGCEGGEWAEADVRFNSDGERVVNIEDDLLLALTGVGRFIGSGMKLLPHAQPDDGYLDIMMARPVGRMRFLRVLRTSFSGRHLALADVAYYRAARVDIRPATAANIHADGDHIGSGLLKVEVLPQALPVLF